MNWERLPLGRHKGSTLPEVLIADPHYLFWICEEGKGFPPELAEQVDLMCWRARHIRVPRSASGGKQAVEYVFEKKRFKELRLVSRKKLTEPTKKGVVRKKRIDLGIVRKKFGYDSAGSRRLVERMWTLVRGDHAGPLDRRAAEEFFAQEKYFSRRKDEKADLRRTGKSVGKTKAAKGRRGDEDAA